MSTDTTPTTTQQSDAEKLRRANDLLDDVARNQGGQIDTVLRDTQHVHEEIAAILRESDGDITRTELAERLYPTGGQR